MIPLVKPEIPHSEQNSSAAPNKPSVSAPVDTTPSKIESAPSNGGEVHVDKAVIQFPPTTQSQNSVDKGSSRTITSASWTPVNILSAVQPAGSKTVPHPHSVDLKSFSVTKVPMPPSNSSAASSSLGGTKRAFEADKSKSAGAVRSEQSTSATISSESHPKKRRYIPGGSGGGGRYADEDQSEVPAGGDRGEEPLDAPAAKKIKLPSG